MDYELTPEERQTYSLDKVIVGFDRVDREYITADQIILVRNK